MPYLLNKPSKKKKGRIYLLSKKFKKSSILQIFKDIIDLYENKDGWCQEALFEDASGEKTHFEDAYKCCLAGFVETVPLAKKELVFRSLMKEIFKTEFGKKNAVSLSFFNDNVSKESVLSVLRKARNSFEKKRSGNE